MVESTGCRKDEEGGEIEMRVTPRVETQQQLGGGSVTSNVRRLQLALVLLR
jgi:hypothetical protein